MGLIKKNDPDVVKSYSEITDIDELVRKLADECTKIATRNTLKNIFIKNTDELIEEEIKKFTRRLSEINSGDQNIIQKWFSGGLWTR